MRRKNIAAPHKDTKKAPREIGGEINAEHILEGSVRRDGDQVRLSTRLIDARNDDRVWDGAHYDEIENIYS